MNPENRAIKIHIKEMAPMTAIQKIEEYKIPTPYKEILIALVNRKEGYEALDYLAEKFSIHMGILDLWKKTKRIPADVPEIKS